MKLYHLAAAAALLAGGSAFAYEAPADMSKDDLAVVADKGAEFAAFDETWADPANEPQLVHASAVEWEKADTIAEANPDLDLAETSIDDSVPSEPVIADPADAVPVYQQMASAELTPRAATQNYPACSPGPGDDNCIQLYEPGVETALASWTGPTGGLADGSQLAMGGPEEQLTTEQLNLAEAERLALGDAPATEAYAMNEPVAEMDALAMKEDFAVDEDLTANEDLAEI